MGTLGVTAGRIDLLAPKMVLGWSCGFALPELAIGWAGLAADAGLETCVERAIGLMLAANGGKHVLDVRIPIAWSGLELMAWSVLQHQGWLTNETVSTRTFRASARLRLLLKWANIPNALPSTFTNLARRGRDNPWWEGPELLAEVRNKLVHPPKSMSSPEWPNSRELFEAWTLAMWYLELVILRTLSYRGKYTSRLDNKGWVGRVEPVPWVPLAGP